MGSKLCGCLNNDSQITGKFNETDLVSDLYST